MNARTLLVVPVLCLAASTVAVAETPAPAAAPRPATTGMWKDPFADRLDTLLQQSRAERKRVVLFMHGEEIAGVVLDLGHIGLGLGRGRSDRSLPLALLGRALLLSGLGILFGEQANLKPPSL